MEEENKDWCETLMTNVEQCISAITEEGISSDNIDFLSKVVDIHKDVSNEIYWKEKIEMYGNYNGYNGYNAYGESYSRRGRDSRGRYSGEEYGRRGNYRGESMISEMGGNYNKYMESRGRYGGGSESSKAFDYMLMSLEDFSKHLFEEAEGEEQVMKIKETARRIAEM